MLLFPLTYLFAFLKSIKGFTERNAGSIVVFMLVGLPIYINALSVTHMMGLESILPGFQWAKELIVLMATYIVARSLKEKPKWHLIDKLVAVFLAGSIVYALIPVGSYAFIQKLMALKSASFFTLLYGIGRFISIKEIKIGKLIQFITLTTVLAAIVVCGEFLFYEHLHAHSGFANFNEAIFGVERSGHYDLLWTFEIETGAKRFASIFANPLEYAAAMILSLALCLGYYTKGDGNFIWNNRSVGLLITSLIGIVLALSRASFIGYVGIIYLYALITKNDLLRKGFYLSFIAGILYLIYFLSQHDFYDFIINTITFSNASSLGHVLEWLDGIKAMRNNPLGLGLGESGRVSIFSNDHVGGENQFIITGVQLGVPLLLVYIAIHVSLIRIAWENRYTSMGKLRRVALGLFLFKIGFLIPMFTANTESYIYLSYFTWFLSGYMVNLVQKQKDIETL